MLVSIGVVLTVLAGDSSDRTDLPSVQPERGKWKDLVFFIAAIMPSCWDCPAVTLSSINFLARRCVLSCSLIFLPILSVCKRLRKFCKELEFFAEPSRCLVGIMTVLVICGNTATEFCGSLQPNANKPVLCSKAEGIIGFTYVTENGAGNIELLKHFLYCSP